MLIFLITLGQSTIHWSFDPTSPQEATVEALAGPQASLQVWNEVYFGQGFPAMLGEVTHQAGNIIFKPKFPFEPGQTYCAVLQVGPYNESSCFSFPEVNQTPARVQSVWPPGRVPANLLRFYIAFDQPMRNLDPVPYTSLIDENGATMQDAFVEVQGGLWDPQSRRVTLIIHPGRIKRGVGPNKVLGSVLETGKSYTLSIRDLPNANGEKTSYIHRFSVEAEDREAIKPWQWIISPQNGSLKVKTGLDIDPFTFFTTSQIKQGGRPLNGTWRYELGHFQWEGQPLLKGSYELHVGRQLEDWAGNRISVPFEREKDTLKEQPFQLSFEVN